MSRPEDYGNSLIWNQKNHFAGNGRVVRDPWIEWWYFKLVLPQSGIPFNFTYGVINPWDEAGKNPHSHAFVRFGDLAGNRIVEEHFSLSEFESSYDEMRTKIGTNLATERRLFGELTSEEGESFSWDIEVEKRWSFNAMTWSMRFLNLTNIAWYPAQADARCSGVIRRGDETFEFSDVPCYQDRNWGVSLPEWWTWIVSNEFDGHPESALVVGGGRPTILGVLRRDGVVIGLRHEGRVYSFHPQDGHITRTNVQFGTWRVSANNFRHRIEVEAWAPFEQFTDTDFVTPTGARFHDYATLTGSVLVRLYERRWRLGRLPDWKLIAELHSSVAGIEYGSPDPQSPFPDDSEIR